MPHPHFCFVLFYSIKKTSFSPSYLFPFTYFPSVKKYKTTLVIMSAFWSLFIVDQSMSLSISKANSNSKCSSFFFFFQKGTLSKHFISEVSVEVTWEVRTGTSDEAGKLRLVLDSLHLT